MVLSIVRAGFVRSQRVSADYVAGTPWTSLDDAIEAKLWIGNASGLVTFLSVILVTFTIGAWIMLGLMPLLKASWELNQNMSTIRLLHMQRETIHWRLVFAAVYAAADDNVLLRGVAVATFSILLLSLALLPSLVHVAAGAACAMLALLRLQPVSLTAASTWLCFGDLVLWGALAAGLLAQMRPRAAVLLFVKGILRLGVELEKLSKRLCGSSNKNAGQESDGGGPEVLMEVLAGKPTEIDSMLGALLARTPQEH